MTLFFQRQKIKYEVTIIEWIGTHIKKTIILSSGEFGSENCHFYATFTPGLTIINAVPLYLPL